MKLHKVLLKQNKCYISPIDQFLQDFDRKHPEKSASQRAEIAKAQRVAKLRDHAVATAPTANGEIWQDF